MLSQGQNKETGKAASGGKSGLQSQTQRTEDSNQKTKADKRRGAEGPVYTGIGSRSTPKDIQLIMVGIARCMAGLGGMLRSGSAKGADQAFERGASLESGHKEIYLPWDGFENRSSKEKGVYDFQSLAKRAEARRLAEGIHPAWDRCPEGSRKLLSRNVFQVLGPDLDSPSDRVICWTPDGVEQAKNTTENTGGTAMGIRLACRENVPVHNLNRPMRMNGYRKWLRRSGLSVRF